MLALNDETCRAMNQSVFAAPTRIGVCADAVDTILPDYLALCARTYPGMRIEIQVNRSRWLASALRRGDIDLLLELDNSTEFPASRFGPRRGLDFGHAFPSSAKPPIAPGAGGLALRLPPHGAESPGAGQPPLAQCLPNAHAGRRARRLAGRTGHHPAHYRDAYPRPQSRGGRNRPARPAVCQLPPLHARGRHSRRRPQAQRTLRPSWRV